MNGEITTLKHDSGYMAQARLDEPYLVTIVTNDENKDAAIKRVQRVLDALGIEADIPPPHKLKLTSSQKEVIRKLRDGVKYYYNPVTTFKPYTRGNYGYNAPAIHGTIMNNLEKVGLIIKAKVKSNSVMYEFELTELGKTIKL